MSARLIAGPAAVAVALLGVVAIAPPASAATVELVNPASSDWTGAQPFADTRPGGAFSFTDEFGAPPGLGDGALKMSTTDNPAKVQYFTANESGLTLSNLDGVSYSSYKSSQSTGQQLQIPTVNLYLDLDGVVGGPVSFAPLIFEPFYTYGTTTSDEWRFWDGTTPTAQYWSNRPIGNIPAFSYVPLADYKAAAPNAVVTASGFNLGSGNPGIIAAVDGLVIDTATTKTYDFEPLDGIVVDDDGMGSVGNCNDTTPAFTTIQPAVDLATAGDTVNVCAGTYNGNVTVNKQLTFHGAQAGVDARTGRTNVAAESVINGVLNANGTSGTTIDGFWFTAPSQVTVIALVGGSGHTVVNNVVTNIRGALDPDTQSTIVYTSDGTTPSLFRHNRITDNDANGIFGFTPVKNVTVDENRFSGNTSAAVNVGVDPGTGTGVVVSNNISTGDANFFVGTGTVGLRVENNTVTGALFTSMLFGGAFNNLLVTHNTVTGGGGNGLSFSTDFSSVASTNVTVTENTLTGNFRGISFGANSYTGAPAQVHFNRIAGNGAVGARVAIRNLSGGGINAEDNWFGCNEGPFSGTDCDQTSGTVDADPYLVLGLAVNPNPVTGPATVTADLTRNSVGIDRSAAGTLPATPVTFAATKGTLTSTTATTVNGKATTTLDPGSAVGNGTVSATVDFETVSTTVTFATPRLSISDVTVPEGGGLAVFTVSLSFDSDSPVTFHYATSSGTATSGADFTAISTNATIAPGQDSITVAVPVTADQLDEADETFTVTLSGASVGIQDATGIATITDDDAAPFVVISDAGDVLEGTSANFIITLSAPSGRTTSVKVLTRDSTAKAPRDYDPVSATTITFAPGEVTQTLSVPVKIDLRIEDAEIFGAGIYKPTNLKIADRVGVATIMANIT